MLAEFCLLLELLVEFVLGCAMGFLVLQSLLAEGEDLVFVGADEGRDVGVVQLGDLHLQELGLLLI